MLFRSELRSGTVLTGRFQLRDNSRLQFSGVTLRPAISLFDVARIHFQRVTTVEEAQMRRGRPGVLLTGGEFVEGDFKSLEGGRLMISSVPLGWRGFDVNTEVVALVMRPFAVKPAACEVQTADGSVWRALGFHVAQNEVVIQENSLGTWRLPIHELTSVRSLR